MDDNFKLNFLISFSFTIYFCLFIFWYMYIILKKRIFKKYKIKKIKIFNFGLKIPSAIEKSFWNIFTISNYRYNHYKYHNDNEVCKYCLLLGYSLPFGEIMYKRAIDISDKKLSNILKKISPTKYYNSEGICLRCNNYTKISRIKYKNDFYYMKETLCDYCLLVKSCKFPNYLVRREIGLLR